MVEMCRIAGDKEQLLTLSLHLSEHALNILMTHFQEKYELFYFFLLHILYSYFLIFLFLFPKCVECSMVKFGSVDHCSSMCTKLLSTLERLEQLKEVFLIILYCKHF